MIKNQSFIVVLLFVCCITNAVFAQKDTLFVNKKTMLIGEIKGMNKAVIKIETDYSDSDFAVEWNKIEGLSTSTTFLVYTKSGDRFDGRLIVNSKRKVVILQDNEIIATLHLKDIVYLRTLNTKFIDKLSAAVSLGYNFTKSNDFTQLSLRTSLDYETRKWSANANYNSISSNRNDATPVKRTDAALSFRYYLDKGWFPLTEINWLSNTEQNINLRTVMKVGIGKFLILSNQLYWGIQVGTSYNNESFTDPTINTLNSYEGFLGTEVNLYDIGDFSLLTKAVSYPGISETDRWRIDVNIDLQYDLPLDFFIKVGTTINYDNKSVVLNNNYDYVFHTTFGWSL